MWNSLVYSTNREQFVVCFFFTFLLLHVMRRKRANWNPVLFQRLILPLKAFLNSSLCFIYSKRLPPLSFHREAWAQLSCCSNAFEKRNYCLYFTSYSFYLLIPPWELLWDNPGNCSDWLFCFVLACDSLHSVTSNKMILPPTTSTGSLASHDIPSYILPAWLFLKIHLFCHLIKILERKGNADCIWSTTWIQFWTKRSWELLIWFYILELFEFYKIAILDPSSEKIK